MTERPTTATRKPLTAGDSRRCQVERCSLPPSLLPWLLDCGGMTLELSLCHYHGPLMKQEKLSFTGGEEAA